MVCGWRRQADRLLLSTLHIGVLNLRKWERKALATRASRPGQQKLAWRTVQIWRTGNRLVTPSDPEMSKLDDVLSAWARRQSSAVLEGSMATAARGAASRQRRPAPEGPYETEHPPSEAVANSDKAPTGWTGSIRGDPMEVTATASSSGASWLGPAYDSQ